VAVRNYELDSGAYYLNLLWNYFLTPGLYQPERLLAEPLLFDAANLLVDVWMREQRHNASTSPYRFHELQNEGLGSPVGYTGG
jgi:meiotically up-regulated gene 157 (Mug157) protein